ncbi:MAG: hypothetical protein Q9208_005644 [Pyrenodesmia sp. 3 TL-2023]
MVVFIPRSPPESVLQVISTVALTASLTSLFQYDFNVGSFAQFGDPGVVARIDHRSERTDFRNMAHLAIRQQLDAEDFTDEFILIDEHTAQTHAVWWVVTTQKSKDLTEMFIGFDDPPVTYPGEDFTLWQTHIMIQSLANVLPLVACAFKSIFDYLGGHKLSPYDPHNPQEPPFDLGVDFITRPGAERWIWGHHITATFSEVMVTNDLSITIFKGTRWCVALTPEAAKLAGLLSPAGLRGEAALREWSRFDQRGDGPPRPGDVITLRQNYDWDSSRWPPPGDAAPFPGPTGDLSLARRIGRRPSHPRVESPQQCVQRTLGRPGPPPQLVATS